MGRRPLDAANHHIILLPDTLAHLPKRSLPNLCGSVGTPHSPISPLYLYLSLLVSMSLYQSLYVSICLYMSLSISTSLPLSPVSISLQLSPVSLNFDIWILFVIWALSFGFRMYLCLSPPVSRRLQFL
jgi:hypothetical protein